MSGQAEHQNQVHCIKCGTWYAVELKQCPNPECGYVCERDREPKADDPDDQDMA